MWSQYSPWHDAARNPITNNEIFLSITGKSHDNERKSPPCNLSNLVDPGEMEHVKRNPGKISNNRRSRIYTDKISEQRLEN
ncbi:hypothetical protein J6590_012256 [Homalodisca vitripennis]|nr:hypothetical protein J6590_012256 [Homalodisca vitripennis]